MGLWLGHLARPVVGSTVTGRGSARASLVLLLCVGPCVVWIWLLVRPDLNGTLLLPSEHFLVVTLVSVLAVGVAFLVVRTALVMEQYQVLLIALGFMSMAGFFTIHALATPGAHTSNTGIA